VPKLEKRRDSDGGAGDDTDQIEMEAAETIQGVLAERLFVEITRLRSSILPLFSDESQRLLEERLLSRISQIVVE
jgi:hypothetical protein